jgi:monofunctional glycosyltransferase
VARSGRRHWISSVGRGIGIAGAAAFACLSYSWITLPDVRPLRTANPASTAFMRMRAEEARAAGKTPTVTQKWLPLARISPTLQKAVLTAEDAAFWSHDGIDLNELQASMEINWARGDFSRGGSTITQQLAKNLYLTPQRNPYRKVVELMIARQLEANLRKARILELYMNLIEWGDGIWGADAAARVYFGRSASELSVDQAALMAGSIINPRVYSPASPNARLLRRQQIIARRITRGVVVPNDGGSVEEPPPHQATLTETESLDVEEPAAPTTSAESESPPVPDRLSTP